jgi:hypothetical protein
MLATPPSPPAKTPVAPGLMRGDSASATAGSGHIGGQARRASGNLAGGSEAMVDEIRDELADRQHC